MDDLNQPTTITPQPSQTRDRMNSSFEDSNGSGSKVIPIIIVLVLLILVGAGSYVLGNKKTQTVVENKVTIQSSPTSTADPTANWKTYINSNLEFIFKYSPSY